MIFFFSWDKHLDHNPLICTNLWYQVSSREAYAISQLASDGDPEKAVCQQGLEHAAAEAGYLGLSSRGIDGPGSGEKVQVGPMSDTDLLKDTSGRTEL